MEAAAKSERMLQIFSRLIRGDVLSKKELAQQFRVTERSIRRDMEALRCFFAEQGLQQEIVYDKGEKGYRLEQSEASLLSSSEIMAVCKILMESRSMVREEMFPILDKLVACSVPEQNKKEISRRIGSEKYHYTEPMHGRLILPVLGEIEEAVREHCLLEFQYEWPAEARPVHRIVEPVGLLFSECYFYLAALTERKGTPADPRALCPAVFRIDCISALRKLDRRFRIPYEGRFPEEKFRKEVQRCRRSAEPAAGSGDSLSE